MKLSIVIALAKSLKTTCTRTVAQNLGSLAPLVRAGEKR